MRSIILLLGLIAGLAVKGHNLKGTVLDNRHEPLPYATVMIKSSRVAVLGDSLGRFDLSSAKVAEGDSLIVSYIGYKTKAVPVGAFSDNDGRQISLSPSAALLKEVTVYPGKKVKRKIVTRGKKHKRAMLTTCLNGEVAGMCFGFEFHTKKNKRLILDKVGFYYSDGDNQMSKMKFRLNVYDMSRVTKSPTIKFENVLSEPIYFDYKLRADDNGRFEFDLPKQVVLPTDAMVEIEFLEDLGNEVFWFKSNLLGKQTWSREIRDGNWWVKDPFATPFFIDCIEVDAAER